MNNLKMALARLGKAFRLLEDIVAVGGMLFFGVCILYEIIVRAMGRSGLPWLQEFSQYMFVISVFIGSSRAVETDDHMVMDMLYRVTPAKFHGAVQCLVDLLMVALSLFLCSCTYRYWAYLNRMGTSTQTVTGIKMAVIWLPVLFCMATMSIRYGIVLVRRVAGYVRTLRGGQPANPS